MQLPLDKIHITQYFGESPEYYKKYGMGGHNGLDLRTKFLDSPLGKRPVYAVEDCVVTYVAWDNTGYGYHIRCAGEQGEFVYAHLDTIMVAKSQVVKEGTQIGITDNTGDSTGAHLHWGWRPKNYNVNNGFYGYENPLRLFKQKYKLLCLNADTSVLEEFKSRVSKYTHDLLDIEYDLLEYDIGVSIGMPTYDQVRRVIDSINTNGYHSVVIFYPWNPNAAYASESYYPERKLPFVTIPSPSNAAIVTHEFLHLFRDYIFLYKIGRVEEVGYYPTMVGAGFEDIGWRFEEQYEELIPYIIKLGQLNNSDMKITEENINQFYQAIFHRDADQEGRDFWIGKDTMEFIAGARASKEYELFDALFKAGKKIEEFGRSDK
jgi:murein DD-endopeptidase MepM/ murein hydrolase activator NlpD